MQTLSRAVRNVAAQLGSQVVTWGATLMYTAALGRHLGDSGLGVLYLGISFASLFGVLVNFGLDPLISRAIARSPEELSKYLIHGLGIKAVFWVVAFFGIQGSAMLLEYPPETHYILTIYSFAIALMSVSSLLSSAYRGLERMAYPSTATIIEKTLVAVVGVALLRAGGVASDMAWVAVLGAAANVICLMIGLAREISFSWSIDRVFLRTLVVTAAPFVAYYVVTMINWRIDAVMLSKMTNNDVLGWYAASFRLFETLLFLQHIVAGSVMMPILSRLSRDSHDAMRLAFEKGLGVLLIAGIPMCAGLIVLADPIITFIYARPDLNPAIPVLQVLAISLVVLYTNSAMCWALISLNKERILIPVFTAAAVGNIVLNLLLIPQYQHVGAAVSTLASEVLIGVLAFILLPKWLLSKSSLVLVAKATLSAVGMAAALLIATGLPVLLLIPVGGIVYVLLMLTLRAVPYDDIRMLQRALSPTRRNASVGESHA